jgi:predicted MFS family arabinose efflux permease
MVTLFAVAAGFSVANIYYCQPLLTAVAAGFRVGSDTASLLVTVGTVGYVAGLALLVPLGDVMDRRRLIVTLLSVVAVAQGVSAVAPSIPVLLLAATAMSLTAVVAPILVAFAATLAPAEQRGRVTGKVLSGVLMGVLLARTGGGLVAQWGGWRSVYAVAAILMVVLALALYRTLPQVAPAAKMRYPQLLRSVFTIMREEPVLRLRCLYGFVSFAGFTALWTSIAFLLARPPYSFGEAVIGLFGLAGVVGAWAARVAGPLVDRGKDHMATGLLLFTVLLGWVFMGLAGGQWLISLVLGVVLLDLGVQGMQVTNLSVNYRLRPEARSRITTAYMTTYFGGAVAGSAASGAAYAAGGWPAVVWVGGGFAAVGLLLWGGESLFRRRGTAS